MPSYFPENNAARADDTETRSLQKINDLLNDGISVSASVGVAGPVSQAATQSITTGGTSQQVFPANSSRKYLLVQNLSDTDMYLGVGFTPSSSTPTGILLQKNGGGIVFEGTYIVNSEINIVCATTGKRFSAVQG